MSSRTIGYILGTVLCVAGLVAALAFEGHPPAAKPSAIDTWRVFRDLEMPARKHHFVEYAGLHKAPKDVLELIRKLPDREYRTLYEVNAALEAKSVFQSLAAVLTNHFFIGGVLFVAGCVVGLMFTHAPAIALRELSSYCVSPIAYVLIAAYVVGVAFVFNADLQTTGRAQMEETFYLMTWFALFLCPVITMRLLAEEARAGTMETMFTVPITDFELTAGKFAGGFLFFLIMQAPTLVFVYVLAHRGNADIGVIISSYAGLLLLGALLISVGLLISAITANQVIAAFVSFVAMFVLFMFTRMGEALGGWWGSVISYAGVDRHCSDFMRGMVQSQHVLYYLTVTAFFIFATVRVVESHKWR